MVVGLLGCWVVGFLGCWVVGLLGCFSIVGLLGSLVLWFLGCWVARLLCCCVSGFLGYSVIDLCGLEGLGLLVVWLGCWVVGLCFGCWVVGLGLLGCCVFWLLGYWDVGFLDCWVSGLLECWVFQRRQNNQKTSRVKRPTQPPTTESIWPGGMREAIKSADHRLR